MTTYRLIRRYGTGVLALFVLLLSTVTVGAEDTGFFSLADLQVGMKGTVKTVVQGTRVETFHAEVLGLLPDAGYAGDLILVRVSGDVVDRVGGIASGMSGSPVYIDGKLLGAIGYGFPMADHTLGLVTPIEYMLPVLGRVPEEARTPVRDHGAAKVTAVSPFIVNDNTITQVAVAANAPHAAELAAQLGSDTLVAAPVQTPLLVSGLGERALERLGELLAPYNVVPTRGGGSLSGLMPGAKEVKLEPGAALGVQLAAGDVSMVGIGTVTYVDEDGFLAFGHPFLNMGDTDFMATTAYIHYTVPSLEFPFKLGSPLEQVGRVMQDRGAAIAGTTATRATTLPVQINVFDRDSGKRLTFRSELAPQESLTTQLATVVSLEALDRALDRFGPGTARVIMQIAGDGLPKRVVRDNMYYSHGDIAGTSLAEFLTGMDAVMTNEFQDVHLTSIRLDVEIEQARWTARIVEAQPQQSDVYPGGTVDIDVAIRPYRGGLQVKTLRLDIPAEVRPGEVAVTVRSGGFGFFRAPADYVPTGVDDPEDEETGAVDEFLGGSIPSLDDLLDVFMNREKNNEIVAEFFPYYLGNGPFGDVSMGEPELSLPMYSGLYQPVHASLATRYVIQGGDTFTLRIMSPPDEAADESLEGGDGESPQWGRPQDDAGMADEGQGEGVIPAEEDVSGDDGSPDVPKQDENGGNGSGTTPKEDSPGSMQPLGGAK